MQNRKVKLINTGHGYLIRLSQNGKKVYLTRSGKSYVKSTDLRKVYGECLVLDIDKAKNNFERCKQQAREYNIQEAIFRRFKLRMLFVDIFGF